MSFDKRGDTFISTIFFCHDSGNMADTVIKPSGGTAAFLEMKRKAWLKLQYVSGYSGYTNKIFMELILKFLERYYSVFIQENLRD